MKLRTAVLWISALVLIIALAGLVYLGTFTRYLADDFCMAGDALHIGLANMLVKWYGTWTGRFMFILGTGLFGLAGPKVAGWVPALASIAWLVGIAWSIVPVIKRLGWPKPVLLSVAAGSLILLVLLSTIPNLFQSFFWQDGMVNYTLPLIGLTYCCGIVLHAWLGGAKPLPASIAVFILAFLSGGFTEASTALELTLFVIALALSITLKDRAGRKSLIVILSAAVLGAFLAIVVVYVAPGNQLRLQAVAGQSAHPGVLRIITFSIRNMVYIFGKFFLRSPFWAAVSIVVPFITAWLVSTSPSSRPEKLRLSWLWDQGWLRSIVFTGSSALVLVTAACAPVVFAVNAYPEDRTIIIPQFVVVTSVIIISAALGTGLGQLGVFPSPAHKPAIQRALAVSVLVVVLFASGVSLRHTSSQLGEYRSYQQLWDARAAMIQQAVSTGQTEISVPGKYSLFGVADLSVDPGNWVNRCMAYYYGLATITGK